MAIRYLAGLFKTQLHFTVIINMFSTVRTTDCTNNKDAAESKVLNPVEKINRKADGGVIVVQVQVWLVSPFCQTLIEDLNPCKWFILYSDSMPSFPDPTATLRQRHDHKGRDLCTVRGIWF